MRCSLAVKGRGMNTASVRGMERDMNMTWACSTAVRMPDCRRGWDEVGLVQALVVEEEEAEEEGVGVVGEEAAEEGVGVVEEEEEEEAYSTLVRKMADTFVSEDTPWA